MSSHKTIDSQKRTDLNSKLWWASHKQCTQKNDDQAIRWVREGACLAVTQRTRVNSTNDYKQLTLDELKKSIDYLNDGKGVLDTLKPQFDQSKTKFRTADQNKKLHFVAQKCALHFVKCDVYVECGDLTFTGDKLRKELNRAFDAGRLTGYLQKYLYDWIKPTIFRMLKESGLRYEKELPAPTAYLNWHEITREEANVLIIRFQRMLSEVQERYIPVKPDATAAIASLN